MTGETHGENYLSFLFPMSTFYLHLYVQVKQPKTCSIKPFHQLTRWKCYVCTYKKTSEWLVTLFVFFYLKSLKIKNIPNCWREYTASCMWIQNRSFPRDILSYDTVRGSSVVERFITWISKGTVYFLIEEKWQQLFPFIVAK